jgi:hypothetical protein
MLYQFIYNCLPQTWHTNSWHSKVQFSHQFPCCGHSKSAHSSLRPCVTIHDMLFLMRYVLLAIHTRRHPLSAICNCLCVHLQVPSICRLFHLCRQSEDVTPPQWYLLLRYIALWQPWPPHYRCLLPQRYTSMKYVNVTGQTKLLLYHTHARTHTHTTHVHTHTHTQNLTSDSDIWLQCTTEKKVQVNENWQFSHTTENLYFCYYNKQTNSWYTAII